MTFLPPRRRLRFSLPIATILVGVAVLAAGCATAPADAAGRLPGAAPATPAVNGATLDAPAPSPSASPSAPVSPSPSPSASTPPPEPVDPFTQLDKKTQKEFRPCITKTVRPNSSGTCARLVVKKLKAAGFYPWGSTSTINLAAANAILNYQRSRGLTADAIVKKTTWMALATKAKALPEVLPAKCLTKGIVLCVDQAHRKLSWLKNGTVVKTFKVRVGGWNYLKKKDAKQGKWKVYATANGTWKVYDKQVNPKSENYGSGAMPYSTMFYPDMYVHYSPGFHSVGYRSSSHGCVNIGKLSEAQWIFKHTPIGAKVYIFSPKAA